MDNEKSFTRDKQIVFLSMLYMSLFLASLTVGYKIFTFGDRLYCASILIFPCLFPLSDALTELYGVKLGKSLIWFTLICEIIFVGFTSLAVRLPSPVDWNHQTAYIFLTSSFMHILLADTIAVLTSFYLNVHLINRWRSSLKGKYFYLRSLGASAVGEIIYTILVNIIAYFAVLPFHDIFNIIVSDYIFKLIYTIIIIYPVTLLVIYIKTKNNLPEYTTKYNPFSMRSFKKIVEDFTTQKTE